MLLLLLACAGSRVQPAVAPDPPAAGCFDLCMHDNQARAVAIEVIEADCRTACGLPAEPPTVPLLPDPRSKEK